MKKALALWSAVIYTVLIAIAMYVSFSVRWIAYTDPKLVEALWIFEIVMTIFTLFIAWKYFSFKEIGFGKMHKKWLFWMIPLFILLWCLWLNILSFGIQNGGLWENWKLISLIGCTTFLVGFSEELMYRWIVFQAFLQKNKVFSAVFFSALCFSLLHSANIFWGLGFDAVITQLILTFIFWLVFALLRIQLNNIIPLIVFHWLWNFALITSAVIGYQNPLAMGVFLLMEVVLLIVLIIIIKKWNSLK